jgi:hypothetical protein
MQCFICGEQMRVVMVEPHVIDMPGFELRTFQCVGCGDVEKHPVFDSTRSPRAPIPPGVPIPEAIAVPEATAPMPSHKMKTILGGLVRLRGGAADS